MGQERAWCACGCLDTQTTNWMHKVLLRHEGAWCLWAQQSLSCTFSHYFGGFFNTISLFIKKKKSLFHYVWGWCHSPYTNCADSFEGVPPYPLYKRLSAALYRSIISGAFWEIYSTMALIHEDSSLKQKEEWNKLVVDKGLELVNVKF